MNCLHCGKPINKEEGKWHSKCIKSFFGTSKLPIVDLTKEKLEKVALENTNKGYTVPGVQKKLSLHLAKESNPRLTLVNYPSGYILKPTTEEYVSLPEMEYLIMQMAKASGIHTVPFALIEISNTNEFAYITKRIDRVLLDKPQKLAMEDFCQLDEKLTENKYRGSYERCGKIISKYSSQPGLDVADFFLRLLFSFVIGNSDMHLKNFSLIETSVESGVYRLSEAYDMLSTNIVLPEDSEQFALTMNGKKKNIRKKDFLVLANTIKLPPKSTQKMIEKIIKLEDKYIELCKDSYLPNDKKMELEKLIRERMQILKY